MNNNATSVAFRKKLVGKLENLFECPVCYERPNGKVPTCTQGHHICHKCQQQCNNCPRCKARFTGSRNYLAEDLSAIFDDVVKCLEVPIVIEDTQNQNRRYRKVRCGIDSCSFQTFRDAMDMHMEEYHDNRVTKLRTDEDGFVMKEWSLYFNNKKKHYVYFIIVEDLGDFFLNIFIDSNGRIFSDFHLIHSDESKVDIEYALSVQNKNGKFDKEWLDVPHCKNKRNLFSLSPSEENVESRYDNYEGSMRGNPTRVRLYLQNCDD